MRMLRIAVIGTIVTAAGCAGPPKAPTLNSHGRVPVNSEAEVGLQSCKSDLSNTKIMLTEATRLADSASSALAQVGARCAVPSISPSSMPAPTAVPTVMPVMFQTTTAPAPTAATSVVFTLLFPYASSTIRLTDGAAINLSAVARSAQRIVISGRTDGSVSTASDERVAKARAEAVKEYLLALGVPASVIRMNYQSAADYAADNNTEYGKTLNRRAEVEVYSQLPTQIILAQRGE